MGKNNTYASISTEPWKEGSGGLSSPAKSKPIKHVLGWTSASSEYHEWKRKVAFKLFLRTECHTTSSRVLQSEVLMAKLYSSAGS